MTGWNNNLFLTRRGRMKKSKALTSICFVVLSLMVSSCYTFNLSNVMTSGEAMDVIDSAQTHDQDPDLDTNLSIPPSI